MAEDEIESGDQTTALIAAGSTSIEVERDDKLRQRIKDLAKKNQLAFINLQNVGQASPLPIRFQQVDRHIIGLTPDLQHMIVDAEGGPQDVIGVADSYASACNNFNASGRRIHKGHLIIYTPPTADDRAYNLDKVKGYNDLIQTVLDQLPQVFPIHPQPEIASQQ